HSPRSPLAASRATVLCVSVVAFLAALLRVAPLAFAAGAQPPMATVPDDDVPMLVEEHSQLVRVPVTRPARSPRTTPALTALEPVMLGRLAEPAFTIDVRRGSASMAIRPRTHADLMVFLN
ncbi:MAG: hypothetical protein K0S65_2244, partial [Labilithrix sp.]|nr:hypothetical protein [Labilithrix sp.]